MKKKLVYFIAIVNVFFVTAAPVFAHADTDQSETSTTAAETLKDDSAGRATRLETYKKSLKDTLTTATKTRLAERCVAAQGIVAAKITNNLSATTTRTDAYHAITDALTDLKNDLGKKGVDTATLELNLSALETKISAFDPANTLYQQSLNDVSALDCKADPTAFKAALDVARTNQVAVFTAAQDIRLFLSGTIKTTLTALKSTTAPETSTNL